MNEQGVRAEALSATAPVEDVTMKFAIAKNLDRLRRTLEGFTRFKFADTAIGGTGLSHNDEDSVEHQAEMQFALQELRNLVLETTSPEMTLRTDPAGDSEIAF